MMGNVQLIFWSYFETFRSSRLFSRLRGYLFALYHQGYSKPGSILDIPGSILDLSGSILDFPGPIQNFSGPILNFPGSMLDFPGPMLFFPGPILNFPGSILVFPGPILNFRGPILNCPGSILNCPGSIQVTKLEKYFCKTRVGFGRTELSLRLSCTKFCALSSGHGPRGQSFEGICKTLDFHDFFGGSKMGKNENAGWTWSDFGLRSSRPSQNDLLKNPERFEGFQLKKLKT